MAGENSIAGLRFGRYRAIREIGRGATSCVYLAEDDGGLASEDAFGASDWSQNSVKPKQVAIKLVDFSDDRSKLSRRFRKLFATEAAVTAQFDHPNIAKVFDWKVEDQRAYLVMELIEGNGLDQFVTMDKLLPMHRVVGIIFKVAMALDYAHRRGIVHRDIKPANVMLTGEDEVKLMDFGLALNIRKNVNVDSTFINGLGSPSYMSPEQIKGYTLNHQTDLYSLGVMFYQLLTGRLPFRAPNTAALVYKIINTEAVPVTQLNPDLPDLTDKVIARALEKDLYSRYRLGADMAKDLSAVRFQILQENQVLPDETKWKAVRGLPLLGKLDDIDIWELLRLSAWRVLPPATVIMKDGEPGKSFGFILEGEVEVEKGDRALAKLSRGDIIGEVGFLESEGGTRTASVTTLDQVTYLEINPAAFAFATEELVAEIRRIAVDAMIARIRAANRLAKRFSPLAVHPTTVPEGEVEVPAAAVAGVPLEAPGWSVFAKPARGMPAAAMVEPPVASSPIVVPAQAAPSYAPAPAAVPASPAPAPTMRSSTVVVQPLPPSAAAVIAQMALTQHPKAAQLPDLQPFELGPEASAEPAVSVSDLPADAILTTELGASFDAMPESATTEIPGGFGAPRGGVANTELAARFDRPTVATTEMAADFSQLPSIDESREVAPEFDVHARTGRTTRPASAAPPAYAATAEMAADYGRPPSIEEGQAVAPEFDVHALTGRTSRSAGGAAPRYQATTEMAADFGALPQLPAERVAGRAGSLMPATRPLVDQSTQELADHFLPARVGSDADRALERAGGFGMPESDPLDQLGMDMFPPIAPGLPEPGARRGAPEDEEAYEATQVLDPRQYQTPFPSLEDDDEPYEATQVIDPRGYAAPPPPDFESGPANAAAPDDKTFPPLAPSSDSGVTVEFADEAGGDFERTLELSGGVPDDKDKSKRTVRDLFPPLKS